MLPQPAPHNLADDWDSEEGVDSSPIDGGLELTYV